MLRPILTALLAPMLLLSAHAASLSQFTPLGEAPKVSQVTALFDSAVQAQGQPDAAAPLTWVCRGTNIKGRGHWTDQQTWVLDFMQPLPAGVQCEFKPSATFRDTDGKPVKMSPIYRFNTGGADFSYNIDTGWRSPQAIDEQQVFLMTGSAPIALSTVEPHAWCEVEGLGEKVPAKLISAAEKQQLLKLMNRVAESPRIAALRCARALPSGADVHLHMEPGIKTSTGLASKQPVVAEFKVREPFGVKVECERENADADCVPFSDIRLVFTEAVKVEDVKKIRLIGANGKRWEIQIPENDEEEFQTFASFSGPFPAQSKFTLQVPPQIHDQDGRVLANRDRLAAVVVKTGDYPPLLKFAADFGIVERKAGGLLPVTLRNLEPAGKSNLATADGTAPGTAAKVRILKLTRDEDIIDWMGREPVFANGKTTMEGHDYREASLLRNEPRAKTLLLPKPNGAKAMEVVGIPLPGPGYYAVEGESRLLGEHLLSNKTSMFVQTAAINTNLAVHLKLGRENQLVWVTTLDTAQPVPGAHISVRDCSGKQIAFGDTGADGAMSIRRALPPNPSKCAPGLHSYYVSARATLDGVEDISYVLSDWQRGIEQWRFELPTGYSLPPVLVHTVFDRPLFRAGETVHMKHFARRRTTGGFGFAARNALPDKAVIQFEGDDERFEMPLTWKNGAAESTWTIPAEAKLGRYWVSFARNGQQAPDASEGDDEGYGGEFRRGGSFKVAEFRLPVMKGEVAAGKPVVGTDTLPVDLQLSYIAGGGASGEKVRLRSEIRPFYITVPDFDGYSFGQKKIDPKAIQNNNWQSPADQTAVFDDQRDLALDKSGALHASVKSIPQWEVPAQVYSEMEFNDPSGEVHTAGANTTWLPSGVIAGVAAESWINAGNPVHIKVATVDGLLKPKSGDYSVHAWQRQNFVHRKRLVGGFYSYDQRYEVVDLGEVCHGRTDAKGQATCDFALPKPKQDQQSGQVIVEVAGHDEAGRASYAQTEIWAGETYGNEDMWFDQGDSDRIDVIPEKKEYEPGDTAVFQVRSPFREATALVTVEREGIVDRFVTTLKASDSTVRVPIKPNYGPNVFVSVLVVRGRVGDIQPTALVDLGKPAYKLGIGEIMVGHQGYTLGVTVSPEKVVYKTREEASVRVKVTKPDGSPAKGGEFALAAVDEALLELARNDSWQLLTTMMAERGHEVETATAQGEVIGKRHFGLKALPAGGGGGKQSTRELFDTLIKWDPHVTLDDNGEAVVKLPLNDSLTTIRVVAVATQGTSLFGTGWGRLQTTKDVQLFSGIPPVVRDADQFRAGFTVRNLSPSRDTITVTAASSATVAGNTTPIAGLAPQTVQLDPGQSRELGWEISVPVGSSAVAWQINAHGHAGDDGLKVSQKVLPAFRPTVQSSTLEQVNGSLNVPVKLPPDAIPGRGSVDVFLKPKLGVSSDGVREYMANYPYICLEQKVSKAIGTSSDVLWKDVMGRLETYLDDDGLAAYYPHPGPRNWKSIALTAYILSASNEAGYQIPDEPLKRMLAGLAGFVDGTVHEDSAYHWANGSDMQMRKLMALEALSRYGQATPARLATINVDPGHWPTGALVDWLSILVHSDKIPNRDKRLAEAEQALRVRLVTSGTITQFANEANDYWWWMMVSPDENVSRAISILMDRPNWRRDMPRLVRGVMARQVEGHWNTTPANVWGLIMLDKFSRVFEKDPLHGSTVMSLSGSPTAPQSLDWDKAAATNTTPTADSPNDLGASYHFAFPASGAGTLNVTQQGSGKPWATVRTVIARKLTSPVYAGFHVVKKVVPVDQKVAGHWSKGDLVRVVLDVDAPATWTSVVVNDPVPAGATILGSGLNGETDLSSANNDNNHESWASYTERAFDAYRSYFGYFYKKAHIEYTIRLNNAGDFKLPNTRVEAMYAPENFGEAPNEDWHVSQ